MPKYIAFLRAINVGGHTVKMDQLRRLFEQLGFSNVETFIASGNVIFDSPSKSAAALEKKVASFLEQALGYAVGTFIRTPAEVAAVARYQPFPKAEGEERTVYIGFMGGEPETKAQATLMSAATLEDEFNVNGREVFWLCHTKFSESQFTGARLEKMLGQAATLRNLTTVRKLADKYSSGK